MKKGELSKALTIGAGIEVVKATNPDDQVIKIKGYPSPAEIDRSRDIVTWDNDAIKNYQINPILLFAHDRKDPIGKCTLIELREGTPYFEGEVDKRWPKSYLIENGTLKTLSVRFYAKDYEYLPDKDCWKCTASDLIEISIEPTPDNPHATFEMAKSFDKDEDYQEFKTQHTKQTNKMKLTDLVKSFNTLYTKLKGAKAEEKSALETELANFQKSIQDFSKGITTEEDKSELATAIKGFTDKLGELKSTEGEEEETQEEEEPEAEDDEVAELEKKLADAKAKKAGSAPAKSAREIELEKKLAEAEKTIAKSKGKQTDLGSGNENPNGKNGKKGNEKAADDMAAYFKSVQA